MKVRMGRDELLMGLQRVQGVVEKRNTMPILSNILLEAKQDGVEIVATDLEIGMRGLYKATVTEPGGVTLSARKLYEIIKELPSGDIELTAGDNNWTSVQAGKSQFKIVGLPRVYGTHHVGASTEQDPRLEPPEALVYAVAV